MIGSRAVKQKTYKHKPKCLKLIIELKAGKTPNLKVLFFPGLSPSFSWVRHPIYSTYKHIPKVNELKIWNMMITKLKAMAFDRSILEMGILWGLLNIKVVLNFKNSICIWKARSTEKFEKNSTNNRGGVGKSWSG